MQENKNKNKNENLAQDVETKLTSEIKIHTMPEKFLKNLPMIKVKKDGKGFLPGGKIKRVNKSLLILIGCALIFLIILALAGWFFVKSINQNKDNNLDLEVKQGQQDQQLNLESQDNNLAQVDVCAADNCNACDKEQCLMFSESCRLEIVYEQCADNFNEQCVQEKCVEGKQELPVEDNLPEEEIEKEPIDFVLAEDIDNDGLSYIEELIWQTNSEQADTDGDSYLDGKEILSFYSPISATSETLEQAGLTNNFVSEEYGFSFLYPKEFNLIQGESANVVIKATTTSEFFNVLILDNTTELNNIADWFEEINPDIGFNKNKFVGNLEAVSTTDNLNFYALLNNKIFVISYGPDFSGQINFMTTFEMMIKSFKFFDSPF